MKLVTGVEKKRKKSPHGEYFFENKRQNITRDKKKKKIYERVHEGLISDFSPKKAETIAEDVITH